MQEVLPCFAVSLGPLRSLQVSALLLGCGLERLWVHFIRDTFVAIELRGAPRGGGILLRRVRAKTGRVRDGEGARRLRGRLIFLRSARAGAWRRRGRTSMVKAARGSVGGGKCCAEEELSGTPLAATGFEFPAHL